MKSHSFVDFESALFALVESTLGIRLRPYSQAGLIFRTLISSSDTLWIILSEYRESEDKIREYLNIRFECEYGY